LKKVAVAVLFALPVGLLAAQTSFIRRIHPLQPRVNWLQFDGDPTDTPEGPRPVQTDFSHFGFVWQASLPEAADGSPVYVSRVLAMRRLRDLVIVTTTKGRAVALDALTGEIVWMTEPPAGPRWTTSSPVVDLRRNVVYSYALDGYVHRYDLAGGSEITGNGWPQLVTLKGGVEKGSSALTMATTPDGHSYLYATVAGYPEPGDDGDYQGHVVVIDLDRDEQKIFNAACSDKLMHFIENGNDANDCAHVQSGIWARAGAVYDPLLNRTFVTTSNGDYDADRGGYNWGDTIVALRPDGTLDDGTPLDSYTPVDFKRMQDDDRDFGSSSIVILPLAHRDALPRLGLQAGKDGTLRLVNLADLSGRGGPRHIGGELSIVSVPQGGGVLTRPATYLAPDGTTWVVVTTRRGTSGLALVVKDGVPSLEPRWQNTDDAATPVIVGDVAYMARSGEVVAFDPTTGRRVWSDGGIGTIHWQSPIVVSGRLYVCDNEGHITLYAPN
jgi:PQQ-like domain